MNYILISLLILIIITACNYERENMEIGQRSHFIHILSDWLCMLYDNFILYV